MIILLDAGFALSLEEVDRFEHDLARAGVGVVSAVHFWVEQNHSSVVIPRWEAKPYRVPPEALGGLALHVGRKTGAPIACLLSGFAPDVLPIRIHHDFVLCALVLTHRL